MSISKVSATDSVVVVEKVSITEPQMWKVILHNDSVTTMDMVILILMQIFQRSIEDSTNLATYIHENGTGVAGTYSKEVATHKRDETIGVARANGFPLQVTIEPNS